MATARRSLATGVLDDRRDQRAGAHSCAKIPISLRSTENQFVFNLSIDTSLILIVCELRK